MQEREMKNKKGNTTNRENNLTRKSKISISGDHYSNNNTRKNKTPITEIIKKTQKVII